MFEEAVRVPLLLRLPGQTRQVRVGDPVSQVDLVPTLLDLLDEEIPPALQGKSLKPALESGRPTHGGPVVIEWNGPNTGGLSRYGASGYDGVRPPDVSAEDAAAGVTDAVRTIITADGWKLNWSPRGESELYNLETDPGETRNRIGDIGCSGVFQRLCEGIRQWQRTTGDTASGPPAAAGA
jgi:arylsulfatase A-like enzyme